MRATVLIHLGMLLILAAVPARAYRPFDSTDADVAKAKEAEIELGPVGRLREGEKRFVVGPAIVANFGLQGDRELVIQGQREVALNRDSGDAHTAVVDNGIFIKQVLRRGVLQDEPGLSVATEYGFLLPSLHGEGGTGFSIAGIVSQRWAAATLHLNAAAAVNRQHEPDVFLGAILEGPYSWRVRPVAELFTEQARTGARTNSHLVGSIWRVQEGLSFDIGLRSGHAGSEAIREIRAGLTWTF